MKQLLKYTLVIAWIAFSIFMSYGCASREYQHDSDPNGAETHYYKESYFMTDASAERVKVTTPEGTIIEINAPVQKSQNVKVINPALGIIETGSKGK